MAETIGSLVDKITISELKIYHMNQQTLRQDVSQEHIHQCRQKLEILCQQKDDLVSEINEMLFLVMERKKSFKIYRQFKMYNDQKYKIKTSD